MLTKNQQVLQELETTSGEEKPETGDGKELDSDEKYDMMTRTRDKLKQSKQTDDELAVKSTRQGLSMEKVYIH